MKNLSLFCLSLAAALTPLVSFSQRDAGLEELRTIFRDPPASARPWVFWYWMHAAVSREGIRADLEAMKAAGIAGAYLMPVKDTSAAIPFQPVARQLTPEWWGMVNYAMQEARRLGLQLGMHVSDGFALAGGPWITPPMSMQKFVWTKAYPVAGQLSLVLPKPTAFEGYYEDIAVYAYRSAGISQRTMRPIVTTSNGENASFLPDPGSRESFKSDSNCWIQYSYSELFTCRSIRVHSGGNNYQAQRLIVQTSEDGKNFKTILRLDPPRHGWQDTDEDYTHSIPAATARYFRFVYDKSGSEPGAEDLDAAKWKPSLRLGGLYLSGEPVINQFEAKNGSVWRVAANTNDRQVTDMDAISPDSIINLTSKLDSSGKLNWIPPSDDWVILRVGHTSNGHTNYTGGGGLGLECDKFNSQAVQMQFDNWFDKAFRNTEPGLAKEVLRIFHVDSWECGSQNWGAGFPEEFMKRRGYNMIPYLPAMAGVPVGSAAISEKFLHDVRQTIAELVNDVFYSTLTRLAHEKGCLFSAEAIAPTMVSDGMLHYRNVDLPMGEFWLNSPTHDKPNDMLDAISGAHIYGRNIIQSESFTSVRMNWAEHPGNLKSAGDRNFALGINRMAIHVFTQNPWLDKKPGMTLDGVGIYFQRDQTWYRQGKAWIDYLSRCSALLQAGAPVVDIAVFTGEELPRRAVLPDRLVNTLPGIFGPQRVANETRRLRNEGQPLRQIPDGVTHSANMADPESWVDALNGYRYDSFNPDALMMMYVKNGRVVLPGGASYSVLVFPGRHPLQPNSGLISLATARKIAALVRDGARIILSGDYISGIGMSDDDQDVKNILQGLAGAISGNVVRTPFEDRNFGRFGIQPDMKSTAPPGTIAWTHRTVGDYDIYFVANQTDSSLQPEFSFRTNSRRLLLFHPENGAVEDGSFRIFNGRALSRLFLEPYQSCIFVFSRLGHQPPIVKKNPTPVTPLYFQSKWKVLFDSLYGGPLRPIVFDSLQSWSMSKDFPVRYYSGTATYFNSFSIAGNTGTRSIMLSIDSIFDIATVKINGKVIGTLWTRPYVLDISGAVKEGRNEISIEVSNTWHNRLIGDGYLPDDKKLTWTTAPFRLKDKPLLPAGIIGVKLYSKNRF